MKRPFGLPPNAFTPYIEACMRAGINPERVSQTIGNAVASAGFHKRDGYVTVNGEKFAYCAAVDLGVRDSDYDYLPDAKIKDLLEELGKKGFIAWYRNWPGNKHVHAVFCGVYMKEVLRNQVHDYLAHKNGLAGHGWEDFWTPTKEVANICRPLFLKYNPAQGATPGWAADLGDEFPHELDTLELFKYNMDFHLEFDPGDSEDEEDLVLNPFGSSGK